MISSLRDANGAHSYIIIGKTTTDVVNASLGGSPGSQITGTFTNIASSSDLSMTASGGRITYTGTASKTFLLNYKAGCVSSNLRSIVAHVCKDGGFTFVTYSTNWITDSVAGHYFVHTESNLPITMVTNDYIELWFYCSTTTTSLSTLHTVISFSELVT